MYYRQVVFKNYKSLLILFFIPSNVIFPVSVCVTTLNVSTASGDWLVLALLTSRHYRLKLKFINVFDINETNS